MTSSSSCISKNEQKRSAQCYSRQTGLLINTCCGSPGASPDGIVEKGTLKASEHDKYENIAGTV
jgi:hypothetical protein